MELDGSIATVTKTVCPTATLTLGLTSVEAMDGADAEPMLCTEMGASRGRGGGVSRVKVTTVRGAVLRALSVAVACALYAPSVCADHVGSVALLVHVAAVLLVVAALVAARLTAPDCQAEPVQ